jgi:hypothetical protein
MEPISAQTIIDGSASLAFILFTRLKGNRWFWREYP